MVRAICYCHSTGICHRDLKPENFLLLNKMEDSPIKIIDFGTSCIFASKSKGTKKVKKMKSFTGTDLYLSPEVIK